MGTAMKDWKRLTLLGGLVAVLQLSVPAATLYVWQDSPSPGSPYGDWSSAAHTIQDAVEAAQAGETVLVTNGLYSSGGKPASGAVITNRITVDKAIAVQSVNGPMVTIIQGYQVPGVTNGNGAIRCALLTNGAVLSGFTLTNGATRTSGSPTLDMNGGAVWCTSTNALVTNCTLAANSAAGSGGGASSGTLNNCRFTGNSAASGGAASASILNNCMLVANAARSGGGTYYGVANNCTLSANVAGSGGGAYHGTLNNCLLLSNSASVGGGVFNATMNNCTLIANNASGSGGGAYSATLRNCILYHNGVDNYSICTLNFCCTTPLPGAGSGNITNEPQLASFSHLSASSPCRGVGSAAYATGLDIDGEAWLNPPSIGCDEYRPGAVTGDMAVGVGTSTTNVPVDFGIDFTAYITGRVSASAWDFGDGMVLSNSPYASHTWAAAGDYAVVLWAYNESHPEGVSATVTIRVVAHSTRLVAAVSVNPVPPYLTWDSAAQTIQDAVDVALPGDTILVTNGIYASGGRIVYGVTTNRMAVVKPLIVRSVNGPQVTVIQGAKAANGGNGNGAVRCVYLTNGAMLSGFTLTNGATQVTGGYTREMSGGGLLCESTGTFVSNCILTGNSALLAGGGVEGGTLNNCLLTGNSVYDFGGGADSSILNNCTLTGNRAEYRGGGAYTCTLNNCLSYFNSAAADANFDNDNSRLNYCCTTPLPLSGVSNITTDPQLASGSHLSANSPCRGMGSAAYATGTDLDGESWANPPSIGCDEYWAGAATGPLSGSIGCPFTNIAVGFGVGFSTLIDGPTTASLWDFGDALVVSNQPYATHAWTTPGVYQVVLCAYNDGLPQGVRATQTVYVVAQPVHYVALNCGNPTPPYQSWETAATNIQDAVDVATVPGALVLVSNGVYACGGRAVPSMTTNRVAVTKPVTLRSVNGPLVTVVQGYQVPGTTNGDRAIRCVYLTNGAGLIGFTLSNGATRTPGDAFLETSGGGLCCELDSAPVFDCVVTGNSASYRGGGVSRAKLSNCILTGNWAPRGGGATGATLSNCTLSGNSATNTSGPGGGGVDRCTLNNCIVYYNTGTWGPNSYGSTLSYCCTTPDPGSGTSNITNEPLFVDRFNGNLRLQSNSPCINAGNNAYVTTTTDLDGRPRIVGGTVDIGAYEYQGPGIGEFTGWLQQYSLATDGSADLVDTDGDLMNNWQEWQAGTNPTNAASVLRLTLLSSSPSAVVGFFSSSNRLYTLLSCTNLAASPPGPVWNPVAGQVDVPGNGGSFNMTDTNPPVPAFYRVSVRQP
jgi:PKD repeat protein